MVTEFLGGLASDAIQHSVACLSTGDQSLHPTATAFLISACVIPTLVFLLFTLFWIAVTLCNRNEQQLLFLGKRTLISLMAIWYITSVPVMKMALSTGLCTDVYDSWSATEEERIMYWAVDTSLECLKGDHLTLAQVMWIFVGVVYGGSLILFVFVIGGPEGRLMDTDSLGYQTMGFLYRGYKLGARRYWEVIVALRKASIALLMFCAQRFDSQLAIVGSTAVITLAIAGLIAAMPYRRKFDELNRIELGSLFVSLLTTLTAVSLKSQSFTDDLGRMIITVMCGVLNVIAFIVFVCFLFVYFIDYLKLELAEEGKPFESDTTSLRVLSVWIRHKRDSIIRCLECCT